MYERMSSNKEEPGKRKQKKTKTMSVNTSVYCSDTRLVRNTERRDVERRRKQSELGKKGDAAKEKEEEKRTLISTTSLGNGSNDKM